MEIKELFSIDKKDYTSDAKVYSRPSARAVICVNEKVLVIHSLKYDYYKFPGGGIEEGETPEDALIREVKEETGYDVLKETIEPLGKRYQFQEPMKNLFEKSAFHILNQILLLNPE